MLDGVFLLFLSFVHIRALSTEALFSRVEIAEEYIRSSRLIVPSSEFYLEFDDSLTSIAGLCWEMVIKFKCNNYGVCLVKVINHWNFCMTWKKKKLMNLKFQTVALESKRWTKRSYRDELSRLGDLITFCITVEWFTLVEMKFIEMFIGLLVYPVLGSFDTLKTLDFIQNRKTSL